MSNLNKLKKSNTENSTIPAQKKYEDYTEEEKEAMSATELYALIKTLPPITEEYRKYLYSLLL